MSKKETESASKWNGKNGPEGQRFLELFQEQLKEQGNSCHTVNDEDIPIEPDRPSKTSEDFGPRVIIDPKTKKPLKNATNNYVLDCDEAEAIAAYGGDAEPEDFRTIVVLDNALSSSS